MAQPWSMTLQLALLLTIAGAAFAGWSSRDQIVAALVDLEKQTGFKVLPKDFAAGEGKPQKREKSRDAPAPVIVTHAVERRDDANVTAIGTARARRAIMLFADAEGEIVSLKVSGGERVEEDETLATLFSTRTKLGIEIARSNLADAKQTLERARFLQKRQVGSAAKVTDAEIAVERAELQLRSAEENMRDRRIEAPFSGIVGIPKVEIGDRVTPGQEFATLDDRTELYVEFEVPEKFLSRIERDQKVRVSTPGYAQRVFEGHVGYIDSRVDPTSRTIKVRAVVPNEQDLLRPGMSFTIQLQLPGKTYVAVPELSLQWQNGESFVWAVDGDKARRVAVETVRRLNNIILVSGPLAAGDLVVVEGVQRLREGKEVSYQRPEPPGGQPAAQRGSSGSSATPRG